MHAVNNRWEDFEITHERKTLQTYLMKSVSLERWKKWKIWKYIRNAVRTNECLLGPDFIARSALHLPTVDEVNNVEHLSYRASALIQSIELPVSRGFSVLPSSIFVIFDRQYAAISTTSRVLVLGACNKYHIVKALTWKLLRI